MPLAPGTRLLLNPTLGLRAVGGLLVLLVASCSSDPSAGPGADTNLDVGDAADDAAHDADVNPDADATDEPDVDAPIPDVPPDSTVPDVADPPLAYCARCTAEDDCGDGNLCITFPDGGAFCGLDCTADPTVCPTGSFCADLGEDGTVRQCVPQSLLCEDPCTDVVCGGGFVCDPGLGGRCVPPQAYCAPCESDAVCGEGNYCLTFEDRDRPRACTRSCEAGEPPCPDGSFCATLTGPSGTLLQCVPSTLTCVDRCSRANCGNGSYCEPSTGACLPVQPPCTPCERDEACGDSADRCLALEGGACTTSLDCLANESCVDGTCLGAWCSSDCTDDPFACGPDEACFTLGGGGAACLPILLTCVDRCEDTTCGAGQACDPQSGRCVTVRLDACGLPCTNNAECGGPDDLCVPTSSGTICALACDDETPCALGYTCTSSFGGRTHCLPSAGAPNACVACAGVRCPAGQTCDPGGGVCRPDPLPCASDAACDPDARCNVFDQRCEPIGLSCQYDSRFSDCAFGTFWCTAPPGDLGGTCEASCSRPTDCPVERPLCVQFAGVTGGICAATNLPASGGCGLLVTGASPIGRPCLPGAAEGDPGACVGAAVDRCVAVGAGDRGFCSLACVGDSDCGLGGRCGEVEGVRVCLTDPCACAATVDPALLGATPEGSGGDEADADPGAGIDALGLALASVGLTRCDVARDLTALRALDPPAGREPMGVLSVVGQALLDPLRAPAQVDGLLSRLRPALGSSTGTPVGPQAAVAAVRTAAELWGVQLTAVTPVSVPASPVPGLVAALGRAWETAGEVPPLELAATAAAVPADLAGPLAALLDGLDGATRAQFGLLAALRLDRDDSPVPPWISLFDDTPLEMTEPALRAALSNAARQRIAQLGLHVTVQVEAFVARTEGLSLEVAAPVRVPLPWGDLMISGTGDDVHDTPEGIVLAIDLGGDDVWLGAWGTNAGASVPWTLAIDLGGSDVWAYTGHAPAGTTPASLVTTGLGDDGAGGVGARSLSSTLRQGAGWLGAGAVYDVGPGHDVYRTLRGGQGAGILGVGLLVDDGPVLLQAQAFAQGAGVLGIGVLAVEAPQLQLEHAGAGFGGPGGVGIAALGDASGPQGSGWQLGQPLPWPAGRNAGVAGGGESTNPLPDNAILGAGMGTAVETWTDLAVAGGAGVLLARGGTGRWRAPHGGMGAGRLWGLGIFEAGPEADTLVGWRRSMGAGWLAGVGVAIDRGGDDDWGDPTLREGAGFGEDLGTGVVWDLDGNDRWTASDFALGVGVLNGAGMAVDARGQDEVEVGGAVAAGYAVLTLEGRDPESNPRRALGTWGLWIDSADQDTVQIAGRVRENNRSGTAGAPEEAALPVSGIWWDNAGTIRWVPF